MRKEQIAAYATLRAHTPPAVEIRVRPTPFNPYGVEVYGMTAFYVERSPGLYQRERRSKFAVASPPVACDQAALKHFAETWGQDWQRFIDALPERPAKPHHPEASPFPVAGPIKYRQPA